MLAECHGLPQQSCNRSACLEAVRSLYSAEAPELAEALRFCRCGAGDDRCGAIRRSLQPRCSRVQLPPPSCLDLLSHCAHSPDCRCVGGQDIIVNKLADCRPPARRFGLKHNLLIYNSISILYMFAFCGEHVHGRVKQVHS